MAIIELLQRSVRPLVCLGLLSTSSLSFGATPQITQQVNNQQRITLHGNVRPMPRGAQDLGAVASSMPAGRVLLLLKRPATQETALEQYIASEHTPGSANYHKWLTPAQFGSQFGPADSDVQAVVAWLQSQGFAVAKVSQGKTTIEFSGTAGQVEKAFATQIHSFKVGDVTHVANVTDPQIPAALAPAIGGISPLNDFRPKPAHTAPQARSFVPAPTGANARALTSVPRNALSSSQPSYTDASGGYFLTPADAATIYDTPNQALNKNYAASASLNGSGVTIGIAGDSNVDLRNVANYRALFGLQALTPTVIIDGSDPGIQGDNSVEALLDLEAASAIAPAANLSLYISQDTTFDAGLYLAIQRALDDNAINILNLSFGECEAYLGQSGNQQFFNYWQQAAAQGISVTVSSGDEGSAACDNATTQAAAAQGLQVNGFASTPYNIAVGGTDFNQNAGNITQYWSATNSSIGGSALSYIPEIPWNNSTSTIGSVASNTAYINPKTNSTNIVAAGGGLSGCTTSVVDSSTGNVQQCTAAYSSPGFQSGFNTQTTRAIPDVSLFAGNGAYDSAWLICASGLGGDLPTDLDCQAPAAGSIANGTYTTFQGVGGTSASSPAFAGMLALVIQKLQSGGATGVRLGQADYTLYPLSTQHASAFHDVTTGNNSVVCSGSPTSSPTDCGANGFLTGYNAGAGYDLASGLGSVDATQMVQNWSNITFTPTATSLQLNGSTNPLTITHGTSVNVSASVTGSGGTPSGNVVLVNNGTTPGTAVASVQGSTPSPAVFALGSNGTVSGTDAYLPGGSYTVKANYSGDGKFASSVSNGVNVVVNPEASTLALNLLDEPIGSNNPYGNANGASLPYGSYVSVYAQPVSSAQFQTSNANTVFSLATGSIAFASTASQLNLTVPINANGYAEIPGQQLLAYPPGTYTVSASYLGDSSFSPSTAAAQTFTITKGDTTTTASSGSATDSVVVQVPVSNSAYYLNAGAALPTGTVIATNNNGTTVASGTLASGTDAQGNAVATATLTITTGTVGSFTILYQGDNNYNGSSVSFTPSGGSAFAVSASPSTLSIARGGSGSTTVSVTPQSGFTGTVNLTCAVSGGNTSLIPACSLQQASVTVSGTAAVTDTLNVATTSSSSALHIPANPADRTWYAAGGVAFAGLLLLGLPGRRRAWQSLLSLVLLVAAMGVVGCGGGSSSGNTTPSGTYTVVVTATSGSVSQTSKVTVTVQ